MSKHLKIQQSQTPYSFGQMEEDDNVTVIGDPSGDSSDEVDEQKKREAKKPTKTTRKQRTQLYIKKIKDDSADQILTDILTENKRLRREIENLRIANTSLKREHEELIHALLSDRLKNQYPDLDFN